MAFGGLSQQSTFNTTPPTPEASIAPTKSREHAELRRMRQENLRGVGQDRNLWYIWFPLLIIAVTWYLYFGMKAPPLTTWLKSFNDTVAESVGRALPALPRVNIPERL